MNYLMLVKMRNDDDDFWDESVTHRDLGNLENYLANQVEDMADVNYVEIYKVDGTPRFWRNPAYRTKT